MMLNAGLKKLVYSGSYPDELARNMIEEAQMVVTRL
jgi:hypothetical protein